MNYHQKTWANKKGFFKGSPYRPIAEWEKFAIYALAGATIFLVLIRLYQNLKIYKII